MPRARAEMHRVVTILPKRALYRVNLALYAAYGGDFDTAEREAQMADELGSPLGPLALAFAQLGRGQPSQAAGNYQRLAKLPGLGPSRAAAGLADLAVYEGRFSDAVKILQEAAAADVRAMNPRKRGRKVRGGGACRAASGPDGRGKRRRGRSPAIQRCVEDSISCRATLCRDRAAGSRAIARRDAGPRGASGTAGIGKSHRGESCPEQWRCTAGSQTPDGEHCDSRYIDRQVRSRTGESRGPPAAAGRLRVRPLHQAAGRGPFALPGRGAHIRIFPASLYTRAGFAKN